MARTVYLQNFAITPSYPLVRHHPRISDDHCSVGERKIAFEFRIELRFPIEAQHLLKFRRLILYLWKVMSPERAIFRYPIQHCIRRPTPMQWTSTQVLVTSEPFDVSKVFRSETPGNYLFRAFALFRTVMTVSLKSIEPAMI